MPGLAHRRAIGGGFALVEHAWHLAELEAEAFQARIDRLRDERDPHLADFDGDRLAIQRGYLARPLAPALAQLAAARALTQRKLAAIRGKTWLRSGTQEGVGFLMLAHLPDRILAHDRSHALELAVLVDELVPGHSAAAALRAWCESLPSRMPPPCGGRSDLLSKHVEPETNAPMLSEVQLAIAEALPEGAVTTRRISQALGLSARTLQRRLAGRGVSVRCLVEETRRCLALEELRVGAPVATVAASLGFGDARALARAFKRWTGQTPSAARRSPRLAHGRC